MNLQKERFWAYWEWKHTDPDYLHTAINPKVLQAIDNLKIGNEDVVLDHGCGQGRITLILCSLSRSVFFNDISTIAVKNTAQKIKQQFPTTDINTFCGDVFDFKNFKPFDLVVSHRVLHTMRKAERKKCLEYFNENLKPDGHIVISVRSVACHKFMTSKSKKTYQNSDDSPFSFVRKKPFKFMHYFSNQSFMAELMESGFQVIEMSEFDEESGNHSNKKKPKLNSYLLAVCKK